MLWCFGKHRPADALAQPLVHGLGPDKQAPEAEVPKLEDKSEHHDQDQVQGFSPELRKKQGEDQNAACS
jgi:hypothetical protein